MIETIAQRYLQAIELTMQQAVSTHLPDEEDFGVMLRYALGWVDENDQAYPHQTGKRLRPMLLLLCNEAAGGDWQKALPAAASVELLHNFSLIHDDIQDNSDLRHNRPTVWTIWGMPNAINAGDAMFTLAYAAMTDLAAIVNPSQFSSIMALFNQTNLNLTRGQHLDMRFEKQAVVTVEQYISMIAGKSAALLAACAQIGALIAEDNPERAENFFTFGMNMGIAFQIHDDVLGIWGNPDKTGKSVATDIISRKKSLPVLFGLENNADLAATYSKESFSEADVDATVELLNDVGAKTYAQEQEKYYFDKALTALEAAQITGEPAQLMQGFVDFLFQRDH